MIALDLIVALPLLFAPIAVVSGRSWQEAPRWIALVTVSAQVGLLLALAPAGIFAGARVEGVDLGGAGTLWALASDGLSTPLLVLTVFIGIVAVSSSWGVTTRTGAHFGLLLVLLGAVSAVFLADNIILFYVAWESVLIPMFLLIGGWGSSDARRAAMKFLIYTFAGGAVLLLGLIYILVSTGGSVTFEGLVARADQIPSPQLAFWLLAIGFLVKLPVVPLHTWLPDAHTEAPTAGSIVLAGVLLKMGGYGLLRVALPIAPSGFVASRDVIAVLGVVGIVWGASTALVQTDLKRLVAYSSVAHMGFVCLAVSLATPAALGAAVLIMVSHGFVAGMLFYLVGVLYESSHTRELSRLGGLGAIMPRWAAAFVFASLASAGLPALSGFPGEFVTIVEAFGPYRWWVLVVGFGVVLAAAYNLRAVRASVQGPAGEFVALDDLDGRQSATSLLFCAAIVAVGIAPWVVVDMARGTLESLSVLIGRGA